LFTSRKAIVAKQDKVIEVLQADTEDKYVLLTLSDGKSVQFKVDDINPTGRNARGVTAVKLEDDQKVVSAIWSPKVPGVPVGRNKRV
jgi:DNA gyrase/topoisomerase IV subunit A